MKNKKLYRWGCRMAGMTLALGSLVACSNEEEDWFTSEGTTQGTTAIPDDSFVVDYTVGTGEQARASKAERVRSLFYLVYDSDGKLLKSRRIPDIDEKTIWPLERKTMTWAQREALKDTLNSGNSYTAFFIANIDEPSIPPTTPPEGIGSALTAANLLDKPTYLKEAYLHLPQNPFDDTNMIYLWKEHITYTRPEGQTQETDVPRDHPVSKTILLRRILSKATVTRIAESDQLIIEKLNEENDYKAQLDQMVKDVLSNFVEEVKNKMDQPVLWEPNLKELKTLLRSKVQPGETYLPYQTYRQDLLKQVKKDTEYQNRMIDWTKFKAFSLQVEKACNQFSLEDLLFQHPEENNVQAPVHRYGILSGQAAWIGFSEHKAPDKTTWNNWTGLSFYESPNAQSPALELSFSDPLVINLAKNSQGAYECNPIATITAAKEAYTLPVVYEVNMAPILGTIEEMVSNQTGGEFVYDPSGTLTTVTKENFIKAINAALNERQDTWNAFKFEIKIPAKFSYTATVTPK